EEMVEVVDKNLGDFGEIGEKEFNVCFEDVEGGGGGGGVGGSLVGFLGADLEGGIDIVVKAVEFDDVMKEGEVVISGEGRIEEERIYGKRAIGVGKGGKEYDVRV
ncbi:glycerate kinase, partial [Bacillus pumilus]|uniref:glycerate kinase n=1 Tax=Bacillus pumilus TaxID=1408 RepID=UPI0016431520